MHAPGNYQDKNVQVVYYSIKSNQYSSFVAATLLIQLAVIRDKCSRL